MSPIVIMMMNVIRIRVFFVLVGSRGNERTITISTSKIRKRRAITKNCREKGIWEGFIWLNPHSNWDHFSFLFSSFLLMVKIRTPRMVVIIKQVSQKLVIFIIPTFFLIGN